MIEWDEPEHDDHGTFALLSALIIAIPAVGILLAFIL